MTKIIDNFLVRITSHLIVNGPSISNKTLSSGMPGIALYFYTLNKSCAESRYFELAEYLSDRIAPLDPRLSYDYFNGVSGIGFFVEYLSKSQLVDIDPDSILNEMDSNFFYQIACCEVNDLDLLWSLSKYLKARFNSSSGSQRQIVYEFLIHLTDKIFLYYENRMIDHYEFCLIDLRVVVFIDWCVKNKINLQLNTTLLDNFRQHVQKKGISALSVLDLNLRYILKLDINFEMMHPINFPAMANEFSQVFLLINLYSESRINRFKTLATKIILSYLKNCRSEKQELLSGLIKSNHLNYGLSGFAGMGLILISAKDGFKDTTWVDLFI